MEILFVLLPLSVVLILVALRVFSWAIRSGQFEDLDRESLRILMDNRGDAGATSAQNPDRTAPGHSGRSATAPDTDTGAGADEAPQRGAEAGR